MQVSVHRGRVPSGRYVASISNKCVINMQVILALSQMRPIVALCLISIDRGGVGLMDSADRASQ
jgi:hypothetical protein